VSVAGAAACGVFLLTGLAFAAASFSDAPDDANAAPDITSVQVVESAEGVITLTVAVANFQQLPADSWFNLWFDLDSNPNTGDAGDETLVRYVSTGEVEIYDWSGAEMVERPAIGISGRFAAGVLTVTVANTDLGSAATFGVLAVSSRSQAIGDAKLIASDYAPDQGRSAYAGPASASFPDPGNDEDAAPDITAVRVIDAKDGWITFAISTPNYATLPRDSLLALAIDRDGRPATGDGGAELLISTLSGEVVLERWEPSARAWTDDPRPSRVRIRNSARTVTIDLHTSELDNVPRFGFSLTTLAVDTQADSVLAADLAPDNGGFYRYVLVNKPALSLVVERLFATPSRPRAGKPFVVKLAVRRSDTNRGITSGTVSCRVMLGGKPLRAKGTVASGAARCSVVPPRSSAGSLLRGTIAVRVSGKTVAADFAYVVR
jgi:hypothetical protein